MLNLTGDMMLTTWTISSGLLPLLTNRPAARLSGRAFFFCAVRVRQWAKIVRCQGFGAGIFGGVLEIAQGELLAAAGAVRNRGTGAAALGIVRLLFCD